MKSKILLSKVSYFWPVALFPYSPKSHTLQYTGREWVKDVKAAFGFSRLSLTESALCCTFIFPRLLLFEIALLDILNVSKVEGKEGLIEVRFTQAKMGWFVRFALSGDPAIPRDRVILNVGESLESWLRELERLCGQQRWTADRGSSEEVPKSSS